MDKTINTKGLTLKQIDSVEAYAFAVRNQSIKGIDVVNFLGETDRKVPERFLLTTHYRIAKPTADDYFKAHRARGLKYGDWVKVTRAAETCEGGWDGGWAPEMNNFVGKEFKIGLDRERYGFTIGASFYHFPHFVLEKVEPEYRHWTADEALGMKVRSRSGKAFLIYEADCIQAWCGDGRVIGLAALLDRYTQLDGSPCGVPIE
tara:strand:+ start:13747 stop:14358 length:612 start_codon:yes stop_codon:yes gene_type:complete